MLTYINKFEHRKIPLKVKKKLKILIAPLDWGIGHATRCVTIIREFSTRGHEVILGADGRTLAFLQQEFPGLQCISMPGYGIQYPKNGKMATHMLRAIPKIVSGIKKEHKQLKQIIQDYNIDLVFSDNRFGLWTKAVPCIYMTHQIMIKVPRALAFIEPLLYIFHRMIISKYDACWIPDSPGEINLSGDLSHKYPLRKNVAYVGPLSRFYGSELSYHSDNPEYRNLKVLAIISGPEPQRSIFDQ